jgi:hypothetical protein
VLETAFVTYLPQIRAKGFLRTLILLRGVEPYATIRVPRILSEAVLVRSLRPRLFMHFSKVNCSFARGTPISLLSEASAVGTLGSAQESRDQHTDTSRTTRSAQTPRPDHRSAARAGDRDVQSRIGSGQGGRGAPTFHRFMATSKVYVDWHSLYSVLAGVLARSCRQDCHCSVKNRILVGYFNPNRRRIGFGSSRHSRCASTLHRSLR